MTKINLDVIIRTLADGVGYDGIAEGYEEPYTDP